MTKYELYVTEEDINKVASIRYFLGIQAQPALIICKRGVDGRIKLISGDTTCRETLINYIRKHNCVSRIGGRAYLSESISDDALEYVMVSTVSSTQYGESRDFGKMLLGMAKVQQRMNQAQKALNFIEDLYKIDRTEIHPVDTGNNPNVMIHYIRASNEWKISPATVSLHVLLTRAFRMNELKKYDTLENLINQTSDSKENSAKWTILLEKRRQIFKGFSHESLFTLEFLLKSKDSGNIEHVANIRKISETEIAFAESMCSSLCKEGIYTLCSGNTKYDLLKQRLNRYFKIRENAVSKGRRKRSSTSKVSYT